MQDNEEKVNKTAEVSWTLLTLGLVILIFCQVKGEYDLKNIGLK